MRKLTLLASVAVLPLYLAGCNSNGTPAVTSTQQTTISQAAATVSASLLPANTIATLQKQCSAAGAMLNAGAASSNAIVNTTAVDGAAYCNQLAVSAPAGQVPATTNSNTASWLPTVIAGVQTAAQLAGVILPVVAAL